MINSTVFKTQCIILVNRKKERKRHGKKKVKRREVGKKKLVRKQEVYAKFKRKLMK